MLASHLERRTAKAGRRLGLQPEPPSPIKTWKDDMQRRQFYLTHGDGTPSAMEYAAAVAAETAARLNEKEANVHAARRRAAERLAQRKSAQRSSEREATVAPPYTKARHTGHKLGAHVPVTTVYVSASHEGAVVVEEAAVDEQDDEQYQSSDGGYSRSEDAEYEEPADKFDLPCTYMSAGEAWAIMRSHQLK